MLWYTTNIVALNNIISKERLKRLNDHCSHVEQNTSVMTYVTYENDDWDKGYCMCTQCYDEFELKLSQQIVNCSDCLETVKRGVTVTWKHYKFNPDTGEEPLLVCRKCQTKPRHLLRIEQYDRERRFVQERIENSKSYINK